MNESQQAVHDIKQRGWAKLDQVFDHQLLDTIVSEYQQMEPHFVDIQKRKGIADKVINASHHSFLLCRSMLDLLANKRVDQVLEQYFDGPFILNTMGLSRIDNQHTTYTQNIHRDQRSNSGDARLWLNTLVMLDDSTEDNGATWMLEGSQTQQEQPNSDEFYQKSVRAVGKKGDVLLFDGNIWHAAGANTTDRPRHIITPIYSKPFIKQQLDYPRALGVDFGKTLSKQMQQVLGYRAMVPATLEEFYQLDEHRFYQADQG